MGSSAAVMNTLRIIGGYNWAYNILCYNANIPSTGYCRRRGTVISQCSCIQPDIFHFYDPRYSSNDRGGINEKEGNQSAFSVIWYQQLIHFLSQ
jgi:hypothetical protein